jgi:sugar phosphate isomerase/epimerase
MPLQGHLQILDAVKSKAVQVYYDFFNSGATKGYDVITEIKKLGRERICEVHLKEGPEMLGSGKVSWPAVVRALREIKYDGWIILETSSPSGDVAADTRKNLNYVKNLLKA